MIIIIIVINILISIIVINTTFYIYTLPKSLPKTLPLIQSMETANLFLQLTYINSIRKKLRDDKSRRYTTKQNISLITINDYPYAIKRKASIHLFKPIDSSP